MVALVVLNAYTHWMAAFAVSALKVPERAAQSDHLMQRLVDIVTAFVLAASQPGVRAACTSGIGCRPRCGLTD